MCLNVQKMLFKPTAQGITIDLLAIEGAESREKVLLCPQA